MRTTIDIPESLFRRAKAVASLKGLSLKKYISTALEHELTSEGNALPKRTRLSFPLVPSDQPGSVALNNDDVARLLEEEDIDVFTGR